MVHYLNGHAREEETELSSMPSRRPCPGVSPRLIFRTAIDSSLRGQDSGLKMAMQPYPTSHVRPSRLGYGKPLHGSVITCGMYFHDLVVDGIGQSHSLFLVPFLCVEVGQR